MERETEVDQVEWRPTGAVKRDIKAGILIYVALILIAESRRRVQCG